MADQRRRWQAAQAGIGDSSFTLQHQWLPIRRIAAYFDGCQDVGGDQRWGRRAAKKINKYNPGGHRRELFISEGQCLTTRKIATHLDRCQDGGRDPRRRRRAAQAGTGDSYWRCETYSRNHHRAGSGRRAHDRVEAGNDCRRGRRRRRLRQEKEALFGLPPSSCSQDTTTGAGLTTGLQPPTVLPC